MKYKEFAYGLYNYYTHFPIHCKRFFTILLKNFIDNEKTAFLAPSFFYFFFFANFLMEV